MGDSAITIVGIFLAAILMFIFPLMTMADKTDDVTAATVQTATTNFTTTIRTTGIITQENYDNFLLTLAATNNSYSPEITVQKSDANPAEKHTGDDTTIGGTTIYYTLYQTQVEEQLPLKLTEGDFVSVKVQNTNTTIANQLRNFMYKVTGKGSGTIVAEDSGIVTKTYQP